MPRPSDLEPIPNPQQRLLGQLTGNCCQGSGSLADVFDALPGKKLPGAFLPFSSKGHWAFAAGATVLFMAFFVFLAAGGAAKPAPLLAIGLFTATIGIAFLLIVQALAAVALRIQGRGGIVAGLFLVAKLIGFSYEAALDPDNGFLPSFLGFTLGVGLCEEICKALPLLWAFRRPSDLGWRSAFLWGLASGAGFGISEGILYAGGHYNGRLGLDAYVVRFLSCVALHAVWTGSVAITIQQKQWVLQQDFEWYEYFPRVIFVVGIPTLLHGLYDTLLKKDLNVGALVVALLSFLFLAILTYRLHDGDDAAANRAMLREYKRRRRAATS